LTLSPQKLEEMYNKLREFAHYKKQNQLEFMDFEKYPQQNEFIEKCLDRIIHKKSKLKLFTLFGGNRSGKSEAGGAVVVKAALEKPLKILCCTVDYKLSTLVQQAKINKLVPKSSIKYGKYSNVSGYTNDILTLKNGSQIIFRTYASGRETFQGLDLDLVWADEELSWDVFQECLARLTDRDGVFLLTFTSLSGFTRLVNFLYENPNKKIIHTKTLSMLDNPFIDEAAKENYKATVDDDEIDSRIYGKPHLKEGLIYKEFSKNLHVIEPFDHVKKALSNPRRFILTEGIDPHERTPHYWVRFLYDKQENILYVCDELKAPRESMIIADFARLIRIKRGITKGGMIEPAWCQIDTSSMKPSVISYKANDETQDETQTIRLEFFRNGISTILCSKDNAIGLNEVKKRLKVVKTNTGEIKRKPQLYVFNTCPGVLWEFSRYSWDSYSSAKISEKSELLNRVKKKDDHYMDVIKYECIKLKPIVDSPLQETTTEYVENYPGMGY